MTDTIFGTPLPYLLSGALVGLSLVVVPEARRRSRATFVSAVSVCAVVGAFEWAALDPLTWSDRLVVGASVAVGIGGGSLAAVYVAWVRRVFRVEPG